MFNQISTEFLINTVFGSGLLISTFKSTIALGKFTQKVENLEEKMKDLSNKVDKLNSRLEGSYNYLNSRIDNIGGQLTTITTTR